VDTPEKPLIACIAGSKLTKSGFPYSSAKVSFVNNPG
jgi:hypothetical protein